MQQTDVDEIQNTMLIIYKKNLNFFKENHNYIYKKIIDFEQINQFKYSLEFVENHFELINDKKEYIYKCDPYYDAEDRLKKLSDKSSFFLIKIDEKYENGEFIDSHLNPYRILNEFIKIIKNKNIEIKQKFIFLGSILGLHISEIINKSNFKTFLIIEDNIEVFRLSMFLNDYEELSQKKNLFYAITQEHKNKRIKEFIDYESEFNNKINFELASEKEIYLIEDTVNVFLQQNELNYPFSEYLTSYLRGISYFKESYQLLKLNKKYSILKNYKVLFLGGGLSLEKEIGFVKRNQDNFLIVCVAATLKILEKYEIIADIIITSDSSTIIKEQFNVDKKYYINSLIFASNKTDNSVIDLLLKENIFLFNDSLEIFDETGVNTGVNVGNIGYSILLKLGIETIYLLGFDASVNPETGRSHSSNNNKKEFKEFNLNNDEKINSEIHLIKVKGNFEDFVYTTSHFKGMIESFEQIRSIFTVKAFNLSNGAYLPGVKALSSKQVEILTVYNKNIERIKIIKSLQKISKKSLEVIDENFLNTEKELIKKLKELNKNELHNSFIQLYKMNNSSLILQILNKYFKLVLPFYTYLKEINEKESIKILEINFFNIVEFIEKRI